MPELEIVEVIEFLRLYESRELKLTQELWELEFNTKLQEHQLITETDLKALGLTNDTLRKGFLREQLETEYRAINQKKYEIHENETKLNHEQRRYDLLLALIEKTRPIDPNLE